MAILTIVEAARLTGVSRSQLYRYIRAGKLSRTPDGLLDTAELLRAGLMLHVPSVSSGVSSTVPEAHDATNAAVSPATEPTDQPMAMWRGGDRQDSGPLAPAARAPDPSSRTHTARSRAPRQRDRHGT